MTTRGTVLLWIAVLALAYLAWRGETPHPTTAPPPPPDAAAPTTSDPFLGLAPEDVLAMTIADPEGRMEFRRVPGAVGAWLEGGSGAPASASLARALEDLVAHLAALRPVAIIGTPDAPRDPAEYGLAPAARHVALTRRGAAAPLTLALGERNPSWTGVYAMLSSRPGEIVLVGALVLWELRKVATAASQ